jgi:two-component sensor histidine kinase
MSSSSLPRKRLPAAWAVLALALALVFVLVSAVGLIAWNSYADAVERSHAKATLAAQVVATHVEWLTTASLLLTDESDHVISADGTSLVSGGREELDLHLKHMPSGIGVTLVDAEGKAMASVGGPATPLDDEAGLGIRQISGERRWYVSPQMWDAASGAQSFLFAQRIERNGRLAGAAVIRIPVEVMAPVWQSLDLGPDSTVGLLRDDGWQVARHPPTEKPANLGNYVLFTDYLKKGPSGVYETVSPVDGKPRIVGYRKVSNAPLIVVASIARDFAMTRLGEQMEQLALFLVPLLLGLGALSVWVVSLLKRDEQMRANLASAVERNNLLMREIHHRTKNNLQSVASLLKLQPISDEAKAAMTARIAAMSALHEQAYRSDQYSDVNLRDYLVSLVGNIQKTTPEGIRIETDLAEASIDRDLAQPLGLIVNEVISNAIKHAFPGRASGRIAVRLALLPGNRAELSVSDDGEGFTPTGSETGIGSRLIRAFALQLGDDYSYTRDNGTRFTIRFAASPAAGAA